MWVLVLAMAGIIFGFSCQEAPQSGELSTELAESILEKIPVFAKQPVEVKEKITFVAQEVLRSLAHFGLFFLLGLLLFLLICSYRVTHPMLLAIGICLLYALSDELHQGLFTAGRAFQWIDLGKDGLGSLAGIGLAWGMTGPKARKKRETENRMI